jgi:hypothetical protein
MLCRLLAAAAIALSAQAAQSPGPAHFYIVSRFFSDNGALYYYRILDAQPDGAGSLIRYARVAPASVYCRRMIIQAAEARVPDKSPAQLAGVNNPCAVKPARRHSAIERYRRAARTFETISFGMVASCSGADVRLALPISKTLKFDAMKSAEPTLARLWDLASEIQNSVFGPNDIFHDRTESEDLALQRAGQKLVSEVISGQYDAGLVAAMGGKSSFRSLLSGYSGPVPRCLAPEESNPRPPHPAIRSSSPLPWTLPRNGASSPTPHHPSLPPSIIPSTVSDRPVLLTPIS